MTPTLLRLDRYFFTQVSVEARSEPSAEQSRSFDDGREALDVELRIDLYEHNTDPHRYQLTVSIDRLTAPEPGPAYELTLEVVGFFYVDPDAAHPDIKRLVQVNGASILYSAAREYVLTLTGRGPWGPLMLPTVNFQTASSVDDEADSARGQVSK